MLIAQTKIKTGREGGAAFILPAVFVLLLTGGCATAPMNSYNPVYSPMPLRLPAEPAPVLTERYDNQRTGANLKEQVLTVESVGSAEFQKLYTIPVTGQVYAQPLYVPRVSWPDGTKKNILLIATMQNWVYVYQVDDALHGPSFQPRLLKSFHIGDEIPANFMSTSYSQPDLLSLWGETLNINCPPVPPLPLDQGNYNINPWIGIVSTPVFDPESGDLYLVGKMINEKRAIESRLVKIDIRTGRKWSVAIVGEVPASSVDSEKGILKFDPVHHMQRPGLLLQNHHLYLAFGGHQDTPPWHGWIFSYDPGTLKQTGIWCSTPNGMAGGIWQSGGGIAGDPEGNLYVMTGNGEWNPDSLIDTNVMECVPVGHNDPSDPTIHNYGNMFFKLDPGLSPIGHYIPDGVTQMNEADVDLGVSGPVMIPGTHVVIGCDKEARLFVLDTQPGLRIRQVLQAGAAGNLPAPFLGATLYPNFTMFGYHHVHGNPVLWRSRDRGMQIYLWPERDYLRAYHWNDQAQVVETKCDASAYQNSFQKSLVKAPDSLMGDAIGMMMPGGMLALSANGDIPGTGVLWASIPQQGGDAFVKVVPGELYAFDAEKLGNGIWNSQGNPARDGGYMFAKFNPPTVADGRVYLPTFGSAGNAPAKLPVSCSKPVPAPAQLYSGMVNIYGLRQWFKYEGMTGAPAKVKEGEGFAMAVTYLYVGSVGLKKGPVPLDPGSVPDNLWGIKNFVLTHDVQPGQEIHINLNPTAPMLAPRKDQTAFDFQFEMAANAGQKSDQWGEKTPLVKIEVDR